MFSALWTKVRNVLTHPTIEVAFVQSVLSFAISQGLFSLSLEQTGVVMAIVTGTTGLVAAVLTDQPLLVWVISLGQGLSSLIVTFDLAQRFHWDTRTAAAWIGVLVFVLGLVQHSKAAPKYGPLAEQRAAVQHKVLAIQPMTAERFRDVGPETDPLTDSTAIQNDVVVTGSAPEAHCPEPALGATS